MILTIYLNQLAFDLNKKTKLTTYITITSNAKKTQDLLYVVQEMTRVTTFMLIIICSGCLRRPLGVNQCMYRNSFFQTKLLCIHVAPNITIPRSNPNYVCKHTIYMQERNITTSMCIESYLNCYVTNCMKRHTDHVLFTHSSL